MMNISIPITRIFNAKVTWQLLSLNTATLLGMILSFIISVVNTRWLGPPAFGDLKFLENLFAFVTVIVSFGYSFSASRLLTKPEHLAFRNNLIGAALVLSLLSFLIMSVGLFIYSLYLDETIHNELGKIVRFFCPLLFVFPFQLCLRNILQGSNQIFRLSIMEVAPTALYLIIALVLVLSTPFSVVISLSIRLVSLAVVICFIIYSLRPDLKSVIHYITLFFEENKKYGRQVYIGSLAGIGTTYLGAVLVGIFVDTTAVGFFSLAISLTAPLMMLPNTVGVVFFRRFANKTSISRGAIMFMLFVSLGSLIMFWIILPKVISIIYSEKYIATLPIAYIVSTGSFFHGLGNVANLFLGAHGQGKVLRNAAILVGLTNISGYLVLTSYFGVIGAAVTRLVAGLVFFTYLYIKYFKFKRELMNIKLALS